MNTFAATLTKQPQGYVAVTRLTRLTVLHTYSLICLFLINVSLALDSNQKLLRGQGNFRGG